MMQCRLTDRQIWFLTEWFGNVGRELGTPARRFSRDPEELIELVEFCRRQKTPCYCSVQPYKARNSPCSIEKLFFDFDCKEDPSQAWRDAAAFSETLIHHYRILPLIVFSGNKGYHVYVFLKKPLPFKAENYDLAKKCYGDMQQRLLKGLKLKTLDHSVIGDLRRLARIPFSLHEKSGKRCTLVTLNHNFYVPSSLEVFRLYGLAPRLFGAIAKTQLKNEKIKISRPTRRIRNPKRHGIRPCIEAALSKPLEGPNGHLMRLAIAREYLAAGYTIDEIIPLFQSQADFDPEKTRYYVEHAQKNPAKPFKCETIRKLGFCIPNCSWRKGRNA